jgi:tetratricopeptide (TPR) repeat protein
MEAAERDFREVLAAAPSDAIAHHWCAVNLLAPLGRLDEARAMLDRARELDPLSASVLVSAALVASLAGDQAEGITLCERALAIDPSFSAGRYFMGPMLAAAGRSTEALDALEAAAEGMRRSPEVLAALAVVAADAGDAARARSLLAELELAAASRYVSPALTATVRAALGDVDGAFMDLHRAIDVRAAEVIWFDVRQTYERLRADPRFERLRARRMGETIVAERTRA